MFGNIELYKELLRESEKELKQYEESPVKERYEEEIEKTKAKIFSYKLSIDLVNDVWYLS